ncbi:transaldolase [Streptomyces sp. ISL-90]|nr:transaldolase [Streptomyces sp. ISL-90]
MRTPTQALTDAGVSIWLDDLSRDRIRSGALQRLIAERNVVGITTNPTIFATAMRSGDAYRDELGRLARANASATEAVFALTTSDVRDACDIFRPVYDATGHVDGRVSIEVSPGVAHDAAGSVDEAKALASAIDRPNAFIKIPATRASLGAITDCIAEGISINVTLIFSLERFREVVDAYFTGLERALAAGRDLSAIHSVASFFVSRVDVEIDKRLDAVGTERAASLKGQAGIANARLAYQAFEEAQLTERARTLSANGANTQRPLWASTGVKDPHTRDTLYVESLIAPNVVNTMPEKTLEATFEHGSIRPNTIAGTSQAARAHLDALAEVGVSYDEAMETLEAEGVEKFDASWDELVESVTVALQAATTR